MFHNFFKSVFKNKSDCFPASDLNVISFTEHASFPGADDLHSRILKELSNELSLSLYLIFSKPLSEWELPQERKDAIITPLHEKEEKEFASNYRLISLTSILWKIMAPIIKDFWRTSDMNLFLKKLPIQLIINDKFHHQLDRKCQTNADLHLDFAKAFGDTHR